MTDWSTVDRVWLLGFSISQAWVTVGPLLAGAIGAVITRWFRRRDDRETRRKEWVASKFQELFTLIAEAREFPGMDPEVALDQKRKLAEALNQIDLLGDEAIIAAAREIVQAYSSGEAWVEYGRLQTLIRDRFRAEMGLSRLDEPVLGINFFAPPQRPETEAAPKTTSPDP